MTANELNERLEDAIERRRIARNEFQRICRCRGEVTQNTCQRVETELTEASESVKVIRAAVRAQNKWLAKASEIAVKEVCL